MTVVAALARDGVVTMAADRATNYQGTDFLGARKIVRIPVGGGQALLSCAGSGALPGLLARDLDIDEAPDPGDDHAVFEWASEVATSATQILASTSPALTADAGDGSTIIDGAMLLGWGGRLIYLFTHQAVIVTDGVAALGNGADIALGALYASTRRSPASTCQQAVRIACDHMPGCRVGKLGPQVEQLGA